MNILYWLKAIWQVMLFTFGQLLRDKKSLIILLLMPFILIAVLGYSLAGVMNDNAYTFEKAKIGIVDEDQSSASNTLINSGFNNKQMKELIAYQTYSKDEAETKFNNRDIDGILFIHKGYGNNFMNGNKDKLLLVMNPTQTIQTDIIKQFLLQYHSLEKIMIDATMNNPANTDYSSFQQILNHPSFYLKVESENPNDKTINSFQYYAVGMGVMYTLFTMFTGIGYIIIEHRQNTLNRIKILPLPIGVFYVGKSLTFMFISILQLIILFLSSHFAFGVQFGQDIGYLLLAIFLYSFATTGLMILLLNWITSQNSLNIFFGMGVPVIAALGGSMIPIGSLPWFIEPLTKILPNRWAMDGLFQIILERPDNARPAMIFLLSFALITASLGILLMSRRRARIA